MCSLVCRNDGQPSNWYNYLLCQFFCGTLSICIYHPISKAQSTVSVYSYQDPFVAPTVTSISVTCQLCSGNRRFPPGNLPHGHLWPPSLLLADTADLTGVLSLGGCNRNVRSAQLQRPQIHSSHAPRGHLKQAHRDICLLTPIAFRTWKGVLLMGINTSYFLHPPTSQGLP